MSQATARTRSVKARRPHVLALVVITAAIIVPFLYQFSTPSPSAILSGDHGGTSDTAVTEVDGVLPEGVTAFDDQYPGVANLDPDLLQALRLASTDADQTGIELNVNSGWRSGKYQNQLLREAIAEYGSTAEAARWVATPETSPHVPGNAVDIGPAQAAAWLSEYGADYGLCQIYSNEPWHYELRPQARTDGCPARYADPTQDPRMQ